MAEHSAAEGNGPLRRARAAAWTVAVSMAATTMAFQAYHSVKFGGMPWPLAVLYAVVPLMISMCILEFISAWGNAPWWAVTAAYLVMGGAMFLSASATGAVVLHAAPPHMSLVFGLLLDAAALLAVHFILNGPRQAELDARAAVERRAAAGREAVLRAETAAARDALSEAEAALAAARGEAAGAEARAEALARKLEASGPRKPVSGPRKPSGGTGRKQPAAAGAETGEDIDTEARVLGYLAEGYSASEAGRMAGVSDARGRQIARKLAAAAPKDIASGDGSGN